MNLLFRFSSILFSAIVFSYPTSSLTVASAQAVTAEAKKIANVNSVQETTQYHNESHIVEASTVKQTLQNDVNEILARRLLRRLKEITIKIKLPSGKIYGSGVIIAKEGETYYVLTAKHVVELENEQYTLETHDGSQHLINPSQISRALGQVSKGGLDLALLSFTSEKFYSVAEIDYPLSLKLKSDVYVSSWNPNPLQPDELDLINGQVRRLDSLDNHIHYKLNENAEGGTSGGPLLNKSNCLVGIHSAEGRAIELNLAIPIDSILVFLTFLNASSANKNLPVSTSSLESCDNSNVSTEGSKLLINVCRSYQSYKQVAQKELLSQKEALQWLGEQIEPSILEEFAQKWRDSATNDGAIKLTDVCSSYGDKQESLTHQDPALQFLQSQLSQEIITEFIEKWFTIILPSPAQL
ncbi:MAG: trypsin-like peptidase domain-containing protein [Symploca sp. SIO1B1]|nr:trypsin-like peptidase domain-containing protein [Symploca sp. SIO1B1]